MKITSRKAYFYLILLLVVAVTNGKEIIVEDDVNEIFTNKTYTEWNMSDEGESEVITTNDVVNKTVKIERKLKIWAMRLIKNDTVITDSSFMEKSWLVVEKGESEIDQKTNNITVTDKGYILKLRFNSTGDEVASEKVLAYDDSYQRHIKTESELRAEYISRIKVNEMAFKSNYRYYNDTESVRGILARTDAKVLGFVKEVTIEARDKVDCKGDFDLGCARFAVPLEEEYSAEINVVWSKRWIEDDTTCSSFEFTVLHEIGHVFCAMNGTDSESCADKYADERTIDKRYRVLTRFCFDPSDGLVREVFWISP